MSPASSPTLDPIIQVERYIELDYNDCHCWELVRRVYRDVWGVDLPTYEADVEDADAVGSLIAKHSQLWDEVPIPQAQPMDVLTAWVKDKDKPPTHVGIVVSRGEMLSSYRPRPRVDVYCAGFWGRRVVNCYRYSGDRPRDI